MSFLARSLRSTDIKKDEEKGGTYSPLMATDIPTTPRKAIMRWLLYLCWGLGAIILLFIVLCVAGYYYSNVAYCGTEDQSGIVKQGKAGAFRRVSIVVWKYVEGVFRGVEVFEFVWAAASKVWGWFRNLFSRNEQ